MKTKQRWGQRLGGRQPGGEEYSLGVAALDPLGMGAMGEPWTSWGGLI